MPFGILRESFTLKMLKSFDLAESRVLPDVVAVPIHHSASAFRLCPLSNHRLSSWPSGVRFNSRGREIACEPWDTSIYKVSQNTEYIRGSDVDVSPWR